MVNGSDIITYAKNFIGVPYVFGGSTPKGFDCSGLVQYVYKHFGINIFLVKNLETRIKLTTKTNLIAA